MLSPIFSQVQEIVKAENEKGNTVSLLTKGGSNYYLVEEYIAYIKKISTEKLDNGMKNVTLAFANEDIETRVFLDPNLKEGDWVATVGYFYDYMGKTVYSAKGGMSKVLLNPKQEPQMYASKTYKMGYILKLSKAEATKPYCFSSEIKQLGKSNFYYAIEESLKNALEKIGKSSNKKDDVINTAELPEEPETEEQEIEE